MSRSDYAHWNEEADSVWWQEEGRHEGPDPDLEYEREQDRNAEAEDAFCEELAEKSAEQIIDLLVDADYAIRWPKARPLIEWEAQSRGLLDPCSHPPGRLHVWTAHDGTLCIACCDCGAVLRGAVS